MDPVETTSLDQAKLIPQMVFTKLGHLISIISGIHYTSKNGTALSGIIDPVVVGCQIRSTYELVATFNLIFRTAKAGDEREILYALWVHAGLAYRQRFASVITTEENKQKQQEELQTMKDLVVTIEETGLYNALDPKEQGKIKTKLKEKDYKIRFQNGRIEFLAWHDLIPVMGVKHNFLDDIYTYFSLYSHPSNVAVFQFGDMFKKGEEGFMEITAFHLKNLFIFVSIFIADYIHLFPNVLETYNQQSIIDQIVINFHNKMMRGNEYSINDAYLKLG
jgi:hypothetical protein